jgi:O-antigen ligase
MRLRSFQMISWPLAALFVLAVALLAVSPQASVIALGACVLAALIGPAYALQALTVATLIVYANPAIVKPNPLASALLRLVLIAAVLRVFPLTRATDLRLLWPIWLFGFLAALGSALKSPAVSISIMKVITFTLAATVVVVGFAHVRAERLPRLQTWFLTVGICVVALSALTLARPSIGLGGDGGLQGLLGQPQALGIFIAPFAAWSLTGVLLMRRRAGSLELWVAIATAVLVVLTRARTAAFATAFAVAFVMLSRLLSRRHAEQAKLGRPILIAAVAAVTLGTLALATGKVTKFVSDFALKDYDEVHQSLGGAFYASRGESVVAQWHNFLESPLLGNGFGVYANGKFPGGVVEFAGIPISAPIEKGFLPTAVLEEGGVIGAASLLLLIAALGRRAWRARDLRWRALFVACLAVNVGECVFFSPGGIGMLEWLLVGVAISACRSPILTPSTRAAVIAAQPAASALVADGAVSLSSPVS